MLREGRWAARRVVALMSRSAMPSPLRVLESCGGWHRRHAWPHGHPDSKACPAAGEWPASRLLICRRAQAAPAAVAERSRKLGRRLPAQWRARARARGALAALAA
eukprot:7352391-Prymnesium_polylepis.1